MLADFLLAYFCAGLATALIAVARMCHRVSTRRTPERRYVLRTLDEADLPHWVVGLMFALAMLAVLGEIAVCWPWHVGRLMRGDW